MRGVSGIAAALIALLLAGPAGAETHSKALAGSFVSVRLVGGFSPYRTVSYEVLWRQRVAVSGHYRSLVNYDEALHAMKLVRNEDYIGLLDRLGRLGLFELSDAPPPAAAIGAARWEIEARRGDKKVLVTVVAPDSQADSRYFAIIDRVRSFVIARAGDLVFRNVFFEPGTYGYVNLTSVPMARVYMDGRDLKRQTPLYGYELSAGAHEVRLVAAKEGWERTHTLRVEPGMTTIVHFDLR